MSKSLEIKAETWSKGVRDTMNQIRSAFYYVITKMMVFVLAEESKHCPAGSWEVEHPCRAKINIT